MRKGLVVFIVAILFLGFVGVPGMRVSASETDGFGLSVSEEAGGAIKVTVSLKNAKDLYAYDLVVKFDNVRMGFEDAKLLAQGFTVKPLLSRGELRLAFTSIGAAAGRNGSLELAVITFKRIRGGDADIELASAKLVDSALKLRELTPGMSATAKSGAVVKLPSDIAGHWSESAVREAMELGFVTGFPDGTFRPDAPVTRQEATVLLVKALLAKPSGSLQADFRDKVDIPQWAMPYVGEAVRSKWVGGYEDGTFRGGKTIARQELAAIIARTMDESVVGAGDLAPLTGFADRDRLAPWAVKPMALTVGLGIMRGQNGGLLHPMATTTRAEAVTMIVRLLQSDVQQ
ncbi:S-layer homology domain-containing protein [Paenibacillus sp. strain BS8-2]